jgi:hypothetical protein
VFQLTACGARDHAEQYHMPSRKAIEWRIFLLLLIVGTALVLFATSQHVSKEQDNVYFALAMLILPAITFLLSCERFGTRLVRAVLTISYWFIFYAQYVSYQNRPWFAIPDRGRCGSLFWLVFIRESSDLRRIAGRRRHVVARWECNLCTGSGSKAIMACGNNVDRASAWLVTMCRSAAHIPRLITWHR